MEPSSTTTPALRRDGKSLSEVAGDPTALARRLNVEFSAPVGLYDPKGGDWAVRIGAPPELFPSITPTVSVAVGDEARVMILGGDRGSEALWLLLPVDCERETLVAAMGFESARAEAPSSVTLGPSCPEPALRAWGESVAASLREQSALRGFREGSASSPPQSTQPHEFGERLITARLIRRLRISDPPERFQLLATNALRTAMNVQALAWIPCRHEEPVVASGEVGHMKGEAFRALLPGPHLKEIVRLENDPSKQPDIEIRRLIAASADSHNSVGWLIALNPIDGRIFTSTDVELLQPVASLIATQQANARVYADLKELLFGVIRALTAAIDAKDPYTSGHSERVARIAVRLGEELGMTPNQRGDLYLMGLLHDVGKIGVDDAVLKKAGPLTPEEYRQVQAHVEIGVHILADLKKLNHLLPGVRHHHESLDGTGYPCGISGETIPLEARILAVADSYDAMSSTRPYRRRLSPMQIDDILRKGSGTQWDPKIIDALFACRMDLEMIRQKGLGESLQLAVSDMLGRT